MRRNCILLSHCGPSAKRLGVGIVACCTLATFAVAGERIATEAPAAPRPPDVVDLEPLFDDLGDPNPMPSLPSPNPAPTCDLAPSPEVVLASAPTPSLTPRLGPVILYQTPEVAIAVSTTFEGMPVEEVRYCKVSGINKGYCGSAKVRRGCAVLRSLTDGAYDLWLVDEAATAVDRPPDRRIIVQLSPISLDEHLIPTSLEIVLPDERLALQDETTKDHVINAKSRAALDVAWDLLGRRALYSARRQFLKAIDESTKDAVDTPTILSDQINGVLAAAEDANDDLAAVAQVLELVGGRSKLAEAFLGLAKTHEAMMKEPTQWIGNPTRSAVVCYRIAIQLDSDSVDAANDLGLLLTQVGEFSAAADCFQQASAGDAGSLATPQKKRLAIPAFNLGRCLLDMDRPGEACLAFARTLDLDPEFTPARMELCQLRLNILSPALELEELGELYQDLNLLVLGEDPTSATSQWATGELRRLQDMHREIELNRTSFITRRLLPEESQFQTVAVESTTSKIGAATAWSFGKEDSFRSEPDGDDRDTTRPVSK